MCRKRFLLQGHAVTLIFKLSTKMMFATRPLHMVMFSVNQL